MSPEDVEWVRIMGGRGLVKWLQAVQKRQHGHGSELTDAWVRAGFNRDIGDAQNVLRRLVKMGVLIQCRFAPTREQEFFNVNGSLTIQPEVHFECYHYAPGPNI